MDTNTLLIYGAIALFINCVILFYIIQSGTKTNERHKIELIRTNILIKIAEKMGVDEKDITDILADVPKKNNNWF